MNILAIDTANEYLSLAIKTTHKIFNYQEKIGNKQSEYILPAIQNLLTKAEINLNDISAIAYNAGPGGFTGLRIGLSCAISLAYSLDCKLYPIHMFQMYAYQVQTTSQYTIITLDAKLGQLYIAIFDQYNKSYAFAPTLIEPSQLNNIVNQYSNNSIAVGNGWNLYSHLIETDILKNISYHEFEYPNANIMFEIINDKVITANDIHNAELLYLRNKVALNLEEQLKNKQK